MARFTNGIAAAVLFALLFVTANTMSQSLRERASEFGVMKAVGFSNRTCLALALLEALILCGSAAAVGLTLAALAAPFARDLVAALDVSWVVVGRAALFASLLATISVAMPAWQLYRRTVVQSLAIR